MEREESEDTYTEKTETRENVTMNTAEANAPATRRAGDAANSRYVPVTTPKVTVIQRTAPAMTLYTPGEREYSRSVQNLFTMPSGTMSVNVTENVNTLTERTSTEKKEMKELNEKLASYIEKVRFLEAQNKKMATELQRLREAWGKETEKVKLMYEGELEQLKKVLRETEDAKAKLEVRVASLEDQVNAQNAIMADTEKQRAADRQLIDKQNQQISDLEGEVSLLRRRMQQVDEARIKKEGEIHRLKDEVDRLRLDLDQETLAHIKAENVAQSLKEEIEFLKQLHDQEMKEMTNLAARDSTAENREYWKSEMSNALREIQDAYDNKMDAIRSEMESQYTMKLREVRSVSTKDNLELTRTKEELRRIKAVNDALKARQAELDPRIILLERELDELRRQLEEKQRQFDMDAAEMRQENANLHLQLDQVLKELQTLIDAKIGLELEIAAYRKLLEVEDMRPQDARKLVDEITSGKRDDKAAKAATDASAVRGAQITTTVTRTEMSAKVNVHRSAKGNVTVKETANDGKYVLLENTGKKDEVLDGWKLVRNVDNGMHTYSYTFDKLTLTKDVKNKTVRIWARGEKPDTPEAAADLVAADTTWGVGAHIVTTLYNAEGEERAVHTQKTTYGGAQSTL